MSVDKKFFKTLFLLILFPICISASPKQGGTLTVPIITPAFTENFNPFTNGDNIKGLMFEPLLVYNSMVGDCLLYTSPSPRDRQKSRMPSSA